MKVRVDLTRRPEIADPQGTTINRALKDLGFEDVASVRVDKVFHLDVAGDDPELIRQQVTKMCQQLLANPVLENFEIEIEK
ncbi:MAG TPA: phosphoribosylformylglycinamidine synthase subunit PurS [Acidimicrobiia bacterium]